ncbi:MAG: protein translocase subunit SecD [Cellulosilyticaceae bacterium]
MKGNNSKAKSILLLILVLVVVAGSAAVAYIGVGEDKLLGMNNIKLGLDLQGGVNIVYQAAIENPTPEDMSAALQMIQVRLDKEGYTEAEAAIEGSNRIRVDIPGVDDPQEAMASIGATAMLTFEDEKGNQIMTGKNIVKASPQIVDTGRGQEAVVSIELDKEGTEAFSEATKNNVGKPIVIKLDDMIISAPNVNEQIRDGKSIIQGSFTPDSAKQLAERIEAGSLPFALEPISSNGIGAKLGMDALNTSIKAGIIGFVLILIFMVVVYRVNGVAADIALVFYVALVIMILSLRRDTLTLPGIAGIILSIGMAVDANVIIFTRIKEELVVGRSVRSAVDAGFDKAFSAIIDGNITTLIAAGVLYMLGTGIIKSFATTLGIGIIVSMFTALVVTRIILKLFVNMGMTSASLYGAEKSK